MDIHEMHKQFVTIGQKMGMKNIRTLLPESIDTFINKAINNKVRSVIATTNNSVIQNKVLLKDNNINIINALRTLYRKEFIRNDSNDAKKYYNFRQNLDNVLFYISFSVDYDNIDKSFNCRFINGYEVDNYLNDFCNSASYEYPIVTAYNTENIGFEFKFYTNDNKRRVNVFTIDYIKQPAIVKNSSENSVDCDLPDYLHDEIVELAVKEFINSINIDKINV